MAYPSKQDQIYKILCGEFQEKFYPGAKLPPERDYARQLGVARKTLRFVLDRMEQENRIIRNTHSMRNIFRKIMWKRNRNAKNFSFVSMPV